MLTPSISILGLLTILTWIMFSSKCYIQSRYGERSQVVKAVDCGSTIRGFDSPRSP